MGTTLSNFDESLLPLLDGLHFHTLCEQNSDDLEATAKAFEERFGKYLHQLHWLNFGGGHHITRPDYDIPRLISVIEHFRDRYDEAVKNLNTISSPVTISKVEVWVTNKRATYDQARNVVAFADLAEHDNISNTTVVSPSGALSIPYNNTNTLYNTLNQQFTGARDILSLIHI